MEKNYYKCSLCGTKGTKLWKPFGLSMPLVCATCAEKRQSKSVYSKNGLSMKKVESLLFMVVQMIQHQILLST